MKLCILIIWSKKFLAPSGPPHGGLETGLIFIDISSKIYNSWCLVLEAIRIKMHCFLITFWKLMIWRTRNHVFFLAWGFRPPFLGPDFRLVRIYDVTLLYTEKWCFFVFWGYRNFSLKWRWKVDRRLPFYIYSKKEKNFTIFLEGVRRPFICVTS